MFDRNWRHHVTLAGGLTTLALVLGTLGPAYWFSGYATRELQRCSDARIEAGYAEDDKGSTFQSLPRGRAKVHPFQSPYKRLDCQKPQSKDEYESCQQWRAAEAAADQACVTRLQFWAGGFISILGLGGLLATVLYTALSARAAANAAAAIMNSERAYVKLSHVKPGVMFVDDRHIEVRLEVRNHGGTPADVIGVNLTGAAIPPGDSMPSTPEYARNGRKRGQGFLVQGDRYWANVRVRFAQGILERVKSGELNLNVFGYVDYRDRMTNQVHRGGWARAFTASKPENNLVFVDVPGYMFDRPRFANEDGDWDNPNPASAQDGV